MKLGLSINYYSSIDDKYYFLSIYHGIRYTKNTLSVTTIVLIFTI